MRNTTIIYNDDRALDYHSSSWQKFYLQRFDHTLVIFFRLQGYIRTVQRRSTLQVCYWRSTTPLYIVCAYSIHTFYLPWVCTTLTLATNFVVLQARPQSTSAVWLFGVWLVETINLAHLYSWGTSELLGSSRSTIQLRSPTTTITVKYTRHLDTLHYTLRGTCSWIKLACHKLACITFLSKSYQIFTTTRC